MAKSAFVLNTDTGEVYERTPDKEWTAKLDAWCAARRTRRCSYHNTAVPSPMPFGHVMFGSKSPGPYKRLDAAPAPLWTDGAGAIYQGQRVGWMVELAGRQNWFYGEALGMDGELLYVRRSDGGTCLIDPLKLA